MERARWIGAIALALSTITPAAAAFSAACEEVLLMVP